jgi:segregation and condensation protein B
LRLQRADSVVQLVSAPESGPYVERFLGLEAKQRLSSAALESLAIVAYKQPVTRAMVEQIRGVNSDGAIASLIARGLIEETGRAPGPGRPALFSTTMKFLEHFGLKDPAQLPPLPATTSSAAPS